MPPRRSAGYAAFQSRAGQVVSPATPARFASLSRRVPAPLIAVAVQWPAPAIVEVAGYGLAGAVALAESVSDRPEPAYCNQAQETTGRKIGLKDRLADSACRPVS